MTTLMFPGTKSISLRVSDTLNDVNFAPSFVHPYKKLGDNFSEVIDPIFKTYWLQGFDNFLTKSLD